MCIFSVIAYASTGGVLLFTRVLCVVFFLEMMSIVYFYQHNCESGSHQLQIYNSKVNLVVSGRNSIIMIPSLIFNTTAKPFLTDEEFEETEKVVREFGNGVGRTLHEKLVEKSKTTKNWVNKHVLHICFILQPISTIVLGRLHVTIRCDVWFLISIQHFRSW